MRIVWRTNPATFLCVQRREGGAALEDTGGNTIDTIFNSVMRMKTTAYDDSLFAKTSKRDE